MKAEFELIDKEKAQNLLRFNTENRQEKRKHTSSLSEEMSSGRWKENGQPILIAEDGTILDGQHRLKAIISSDFVGNFLVVRGVDKKSKPTIDTGITRGLHDVLQLEGFSYANQTAALVRNILGYENNITPEKGNSSRIRGKGKNKVTNSVGLEYATEWKDELINNIKLMTAIIKKSGDKTLSNTFSSTLLYIIGGHNFSTTHLEFMKTLFGIGTEENSASYWIRKTIAKSKNSKDVINNKWLYGVCIKAWNLYINGNPALRFIKYNTANPLPKPEKLVNIKELQAD